MGVVENFTTWLTGRNGIYRDDDKIDAAKNELKTISSNKVDSLKDEVKNAVNNLNGQTGFEQYVGHLESSAFDSVIAYTSTAVDEIINQIDQKVEKIDEYDSGNILDKTIGTVSMLTGKLGEGFLSVFEGVGDAALTVGAWVSRVPTLGKENDVSKAIESAVEFDVSGTLMSPLTSNALASKYSVVTKDSGAASIVNGAGKALGYATMAGYLSGAAKAYSGAANAGQISNVSKAAKAANVLQSTTNSTTLVTGISGLGQGTQTGLQSGDSLGIATLKGIGQGTTEAALAYGFGKLGEKSQIKSRTTTVNENADAMLNRGNISADKINAMREKTIAAIEKDVKASGGYTDKITMSALKKGESDMNTIINLKTTYGAGKLNSAKSVLKGTGENLKDTVTSLPKNAKQGFTQARTSIKNNFTEDSFVAQAQNKVGNTNNHHGSPIGKTGSGVVRTITDPVIQPIKAGVVTETGKIAAGSTARMIGESALGAGSNAISSATGFEINSDIASSQFQSRKEVSNNLNLTGTEDITFTSAGEGSTTQIEKSSQSDESNNPKKDETTPTSSTGTSQQQFRHSGDDTSSYQSTSTPSSNATVGTTAPTTTTPSTSSPTSETTTMPTTVTPVTSAPTTTGPTTSITTPPSNGNGTNTGSTNTIHTGGGYTGSSGYTSGPETTTGDITDASSETDSSITGAITEGTTSIEDVIKGSKVTKIPTSPSPVTTTSSNSGSSAVIPIAAGLSAAAAAGIGAKAYMDRKHNNDNGEDDEDEFDTDEWSGDDSIDIQYDEDTANGENYLDDDDDYSYQATSNNEEKYDARSSEELADLQ